MRILILGGSGILSADFTDCCLNGKNQVYVLNRGNKKQNKNGCVQIIADLRNESIDELKAKICMQKYDVVIDFLSYVPKHIEKTLEIIKGNYIQYIFISSATVYKQVDSQMPITEKSPIGNNEWDYAYNKFLCEQYLYKSGINYTIIRPYVTFGRTRIPFPIIPDGYHYTLLKRISQNKPVLLFNGGDAICTLTNTYDFAQILYRLLLNTNAFRESFHITSDSIQTWREVYGEYCKLLNVNPNTVSCDIRQVRKYIPHFEKVLLGDKGRDMIFDNTKVLNAIGGYKFKYGLSAGLKESIEYYNSNESMHKIDYKWDGFCDYLIKKEYGVSLLPLQGKKTGKNQMDYYLVSNAFFRRIYDAAKLIKNKI